MDLLPFLAHGDAVFGNAAFVVGYEGIGGVHDGAGAAVIAFQAEQPGFRKVFLEIQNILDLGPAETIDGLGIVSHHAQVLVPGGQLAPPGCA